MPFRLRVVGTPVVSLEGQLAHVETCEGFKRIGMEAPNSRRLAIVGGGPSLAGHLGALDQYDVWAINDTAAWLASNGIKSTFFTCDPGDVDLFDTSGVTDAILATVCDPRLKDRFTAVRYFDMIETAPDGVPGGSTSASRAATLALRLGYRDVTFFGCESSFEPGNDHVYESKDPFECLVIVRAGSGEYVTKLEYMMQAEGLAELIRLAPLVFKEQSGGLLRAMIEHHETWEVVAVSGQLKTNIEAVSGNLGLYEQPYERTSHAEH